MDLRRSPLCECISVVWGDEERKRGSEQGVNVLIAIPRQIIIWVLIRQLHLRLPYRWKRYGSPFRIRCVGSRSHVSPISGKGFKLFTWWNYYKIIRSRTTSMMWTNLNSYPYQVSPSIQNLLHGRHRSSRTGTECKWNMGGLILERELSWAQHIFIPWHGPAFFQSFKAGFYGQPTPYSNDDDGSRSWCRSLSVVFSIRIIFWNRRQWVTLHPGMVTPISDSDMRGVSLLILPVHLPPPLFWVPAQTSCRIDADLHFHTRACSLSSLSIVFRVFVQILSTMVCNDNSYSTLNWRTSNNYSPFVLILFKAGFQGQLTNPVFEYVWLGRACGADRYLLCFCIRPTGIELGVAVLHPVICLFLPNIRVTSDLESEKGCGGTAC